MSRIENFKGPEQKAGKPVKVRYLGPDMQPITAEFKAEELSL